MLNNKLRVLEAFSGIGSQVKALKNIGVNHDIVAISDIDRGAIVSYAAIHNNLKEYIDYDRIINLTDVEMLSELQSKGLDKIPRNKKGLKNLYIADKISKNVGDISKLQVADIPDHDLFTYSFPCQDLSIMGRQKGIIEGETRSGLLHEALKVIKNKQPKFALMENVKNLVSKKFKEDFDRALDELESYGYNNYWKVLNTIDFGLPQRRERVFVVSIRKDIDDGNFSFDNLTTTPMPHISNFLSDEYGQQHIITQPSMIKKIDNKDETGFKLDIINDRSNTITTKQMRCPNNGVIDIGNDQYRYMTELESWRLQGFTDKDFALALEFNKGRDNCMNGAMHKQAGNSISVNVLEAIFKELLKDYILDGQAIV